MWDEGGVKDLNIHPQELSSPDGEDWLEGGLGPESVHSGTYWEIQHVISRYKIKAPQNSFKKLQAAQ